MRHVLCGVGVAILVAACAGRAPGARADIVPGALAATAADTAADHRPTVDFSVRDRMLLAEYRVLERDRAPILLALDPARTAAAAQALAGIGAQVTRRRDALGHLRAWIPLDRLASVQALAGLQAVQVDALPVRASMGPASEPRGVATEASAGGVAVSPRGGAAEAAPSASPPTPALGPDNPYTAESVTQALAFKARHPTYDGRGVTIGFVEPAAHDLRTLHGALDGAGRPLPKFAAYEFVKPDDLLPGFRIHANMVASVMAGAGFLGSRADGVAPAAQLAVFVPFLQGIDRPVVDGIEAILGMMADPRVDVGQASHASGDTSRLGGLSPHAIWIDRLIRRQGKPLVIATGNYGAALLSIGEFPAAQETFSIGAYTPPQTWRANFGVATGGGHVPPAYAPYGPARDGGLKPDFVALTGTLAEFGDEGESPWHFWQDGSGAGDPELRRYGASGGTSAAAPHAAGHVALLVSAARQAGIPHDVWRLRAAIASTAKFLSGVEARAQGYGLIQVEDAWEALQRARDWSPPAFSIRAPLVGAEARPEGPERFVGRGLFEMSGWRPGQSGRRTVTLTRTGGDPGRDRYRLRWKGDTGVFASALRELVLPLGVPVDLPLDIAVGAAGSYSAIVDLIDPRADLVAGSVPMTVLVADPLPRDGMPLHYRRESPRPGSSLFHVEVPPGTSALTVQVKRSASQAYSIWIAEDPSGRHLPFNPYGSELYEVGTAPFTDAELRYTFADPVPGVWQFRMQNQQPHTREAWASVPDWGQPMPLEVTIRGWRVQKQVAPADEATRVEFRAADRRESRSAGDAGSFVTSAGASARTGASAGTGAGAGADAKPIIRAIGVGATRTARPVLLPGLAPAFFEVEIAPGTRRYEVEIAQDDPTAQVGLYLYKVPEGERREEVLRSDQTALVGYDASFRPGKRLALADPPPGRYRIAVDPVRVPDRGLEVAFRDTVFRPEYGEAIVASAPIAATGRKSDAIARAARVEVRGPGRPPEGRRLFTRVGLFLEADGPNAPPIASHGWEADPAD